MELKLTLVADEDLHSDDECDCAPRLAGDGESSRGPKGLPFNPRHKAVSRPTPRGPARPDGVAALPTSSILRLYCREIGRFKVLTREEEVELALRVQHGDEAAREQMIMANLRLVVKIAFDFEGFGLPLLDLISEGNLGLMKAVDRYDPAKGAKLSVYASFWIKNYMRRALCNGVRTIRVPEHLRRDLLTVQHASLRLKELLGRDPTTHEIAQATGLRVDRAQRARDAAQPTVSLDRDLDEGNGSSFADTVADEHAIPPDEALARVAGLQQIEECIGKLDVRERAVLRIRFGLDGNPAGTLDATSKEVGLTREGVRLIQNRALAKLRAMLKKSE